MTTIHISRAPTREKPQLGDRKEIKGVEHIRCFSITNIGTSLNPIYALDCTGGRQRYEWVPVDEVNMTTMTRKREH